MVKLILISYLALAQSPYICMINTGDTGKLKYKANSLEDSMKTTINECYSKRVANYIRQRQQEPSKDRKILFIESCANSVICIESGVK